MNKKILVIFLVTCCFNLILFTSLCFAENVSVVLDGKEIIFDNDPIIKEGRTLVPFRKIFEELDYEVSWNSNNRTVVATNKDKKIKLQIGSEDIVVNNQTIKSDVAPQIIDSRTYVPVRVISEYSDCDVLWDENTKTVVIYTNKEPINPQTQQAYSMMVTDGEYIYYNDSLNGKVYKFTEELEKEVFDIQIDGAFAVYKNKIYGLVKEKNNEMHLKSFDLKTLKSKDLSKADVQSFVIHNGKIYYSQDSLSNAEKNGMYSMSLTGTNKKMIYKNSITFENFIVTEEHIFDGGIIYSKKSKEEKVITMKKIIDTDLEGDNYYILVDSALPGRGEIIVYNYKTDVSKTYRTNQRIGDIEATGTSIFLTLESRENDVYGFQGRKHYIMRLTNEFEYPVEIYKGHIIIDLDNNERFSGVEPEIQAIGKYIYLNNGHERITTEGKDQINIFNIMEYDIESPKDNSEKNEDIADFTESLGIKVVGADNLKKLKIKTTSAVRNNYNYYAFIGFDTENYTWVNIYPFAKNALVEAGVSYNIINIDEIEVNHEKTSYNNVYLFTKGEHSYYLVSENEIDSTLETIIREIDIEITDENLVKEWIRGRGH